jgi:hypothetical protein
MGGLDATTLTQNYKSQEIIILQVLNGYCVQVGCKTVVFESKEKMLSELARFLSYRDAVAKEYLAKE